MLLSEFIKILEETKNEYGDAQVFSSNGLYRYPINRNSIESIQERNVTCNKDKTDTEIVYRTKYYLLS